MRQESNNEMDLLLRRLGRRRDASGSNGDGRIDHLDADELSTYAENALPAAARARYTEHLAECARCRQLVVQLSSSVGAVAAAETVKTSAPSALRKFLASLFSPMVLRYAAPALGLIVVAVIGVVVLRQRQRDGEMIAQMPQQQEARPQPTMNDQLSPGLMSGDSSSNRAENTATVNKSLRPATPSQDSTSAGPNAPAPAPAGSPAGTSAGEQAEPAAPVKRVEEAVIDAPKAVPFTEEEVRRKAADAGKKTQDEFTAKYEAQKEKALEPPKAKTEDQRVESLAAARTAQARRRSETSIAAQTGAAQPMGRADSGERDKDDSETRTVGGRRFRKQGGIWVDTAYDSSKSPMSLTRNSEQYRALVADEPGIKAIADQLDGEFIVVWKGRPYRIR